MAPTPTDPNAAAAPERRHRLPKALRIVLKTLAWIIGIVLALLLVIAIAIQIPAVQNKLLAYAEPLIEDLLGGADVEIEHINLKFFDAASVEDIYVADQRGDTLLYARSLNADIGAFSLFGGSIVLDEIALDGAVVNAYQRAGDTAFNYQFILDAFAPADTATVDTSAAAFTVDVKTVDVTDTRIRLDDDVAGSDLNVTVERLLVDIDRLDTENLAVDVAAVLLEGVDGSYVVEDIGRQLDSLGTALVQTAQDTLASGATAPEFPDPGLPITVGALSLKRINLAYRDDNTARVERGLDAGHLALRDLNAEAGDFHWDSTRLALDWRELSFRERSGLAVDRLAFGLEATPERLRLSDFAFRTPTSQVLAQAQLAYADFAALVGAAPDTRVEASFDDSYVSFDDVMLLAPTLADAGLNPNAQGNIYLDGAVAGTLAEIDLQDVSLRVGRQTQVAVTGKLFDATDPERLRYDLRVERLTSAYADLSQLTRGLGIPPELREFGRFSFTGQVAGTTTAFRGRNLDLRTDGRTGFRGDVAARNLDDPDNLYLDADVRELHTRMSELAPFLPDSLGVDALALGDVDFAGTFRGTLTDFDVDARLRTDLGSATADVVADFNRDYTDGSYVGSVALDSFDVGRLLQDSTIGTLTLAADVDGSGLALEDAVASIDGNVASFTYNGYTYEDFAIDGELDRQLFEGQFGIDDPNVRLSFDGTVNLRDSLPDLRFVARVDTLALQPLGFSPTALGLSMAITSNLRGNNADNLVGRLVIDSIYLNDSVKSTSLERLLVRAGDTSNGRFLVVESPILRAGVIGDYNTADVPVLLTNYVNDFFPIDAYLNPRDAQPGELALEPEPQPQRVLPDQDFRFYAELSDPVDFVRFFDPNLNRLDTAALVGTFRSREKEMRAEFFAPDLDYGGTTADTIALAIGGDVREMLVGLRAVELAVAGQEIDLTLADLRLRDDSLTFDLNAYLDADSLFLGTGLTASMNDAGRYVVHLADELQVAGQTWRVDPRNEIEYWDTYLRIADLTFEKDDQSIGIASADASPDSDIAPMTVTIERYRLSEVSRLVALTGFTLEGELNGTVGVRDPGGDLYYVAALTVDGLGLNGSDLGDLTVDATSENLQNVVAVDVRLDGTVNDLSIAGEYGIDDGALDLVAKIPALEMRVIDPVAQGILSNSVGLMVADMTITGTVAEPVVNGYFGFEDAATTYDLLGVRLGIADDRITFTQTRIDFGEFDLTDAAGRTATLSGGIDHDYFADFRFELDLNTDGFKVLGSEPSVDALYYGDAIVAADVSIRGDIEVPVVTVTAETLDSTNVFIQPLVTTGGVSEEAWVIYADPTELAADSTAEDLYTANALGIDLTMQLEVHEESVLNVIIDPATGDALRARGDADMSVQMSPDGDLNVTGLYTLTEGSYQFSFVAAGFAVQQKDFVIREGSNLQFVGDPLDTRFDITAIYGLETETYPLIADEVAEGGAEANAARRRQPVEVLMTMAGDINEPDLTFDIEVPEAGGGANSAVAQKLAQLRTSPNELYQQVFGLLVLSRFIPQDPAAAGSGSGIAGAGKSLAISSVGDLVAGQLNDLADNYLKGVDINVGVDSYEDRYGGGQVTTANFDVSKSFLDERLTITLGTETNVGSNQPAGQATGAGGLQSSFVLTYQLTENGHYLLRAFRRPDLDILSTANQFETGGGVTYQRRFK